MRQARIIRDKNLAEVRQSGGRSGGRVYTVAHNEPMRFAELGRRSDSTARWLLDAAAVVLQQDQGRHGSYDLCFVSELFHQLSNRLDLLSRLSLGRFRDF